MDTKQLSRRNLISKAGLVLGGAIAVRTLPGCGEEETGNNKAIEDILSGADAGETDAGQTPADAGTETDAGQQPPAGPQVSDFPYEKHLAASYRLNIAAVKEKAYQYYYSGGCCHGAYRGLLEHLATTAGAPFNLLPLDFGKFGAGGIASYGSICGAVLGGTLIINTIVADATARGAMITDLMRWYEGFAFPEYTPETIATAEAGQTTKDFSASNIANLQVVPHSHLCHASVSGWCAAIGVSASGADKKARCARLTADVAGKTAEMLNTYLANKAFTAAPLDSASAACVTCHPAGSTTRPTQTGMACGSCHTDKQTNHP